MPAQKTFIPVGLPSPDRSIHKSTHRTTKTSEMAESILNEIVASLPARFYGVCPVSLVSSKKSPLSPCSLVEICNSYNDEFGPGCMRSMNGEICPYLHEFRTCAEDVGNLDKKIRNHCSIAKMGKKEWTAESRAHMKTRVHKGHCSNEEWKHREVVAGLIDVHLDGRY